ncbi:hypothetical protein ACRALDRAFT_2039644 [Sodiomyces alcalophilus JCM 7366]|uniref:uncharacterized protein n=1 Tax=Sodiomyces alcalophilus JCM 7366 TaxID=591952 RepID=UPI0039B48CE5
MEVIFNTSFVNLSNISNTKITTLDFLNKLIFSVLISAIILLIKNVFFYDNNLFLFNKEDDKKEDKGKNPERDSTVSKDKGKLEESKDKKEEELSEEEIIARYEKAAEEHNDFNEREDSELTAEQINYRKGLED